MTYRTDFGRCSYGEFRTFAEALKCAKQHRATFQRIVNTRECDDAEDAGHRAQCGLTREEWAVLEEEGFV